MCPDDYIKLYMVFLIPPDFFWYVNIINSDG